MIAFFIVFFLLGALAINWFIHAVRGKLIGQDVVFENADQPWFIALLAIKVVVFQVALYGAINLLLPPTLGLAIWGASTIIEWMLILRRRLLHLYPITLLIVTAVASAGLWLRANGFVQTVNIVVLLAIQILLYVYAIWPRFSYTGTDLLKAVGRLTPRCLNQLTGIVQSLMGMGKHRHVAFGWLKSIVLALVVLFVFILLLSQADPVFAEVIKQFRDQIFGRMLWAFLVIMIATMFFTVPKDLSAPTPTKLKWLSTRDLLLIISSLVVLFGVFLSIQYQYLFSGSRELLSQLNLTYSEYVRQGFIELLWTVFFGSLLVYLAGLRVRSDETTTYWTRLLQVVAFVGVIELGLLLVSAWKRDALYMDVYGLTRVRIIGELFLAWLAVNVLIQGIFVTVRWTKEQLVFFGALISSGVLVIALNYVNVDARILATAPGHHDYTDYFYLANLSSDAGSAKYQILLEKMKPELVVLLAKETLNDKEKYQLAGIKLALLALREQRNDLAAQYGAEDWLLQNDFRIARDFEKPANNDSYSSTTERWAGSDEGRLSLDASLKATAGAELKKALPPQLIKRRSWQYRNQPDQQLAAYLLAFSAERFDEIDTLLQQVRTTQIERQWSLQTEENKLLSVLQYPFISVGIRRYSGEDLSAPYFDTAFRRSKNIIDGNVAELERGTNEVFKQLTDRPCTPPSQILGYGLLADASQDTVPEYSAYFFSPVTNPQDEMLGVVKEATDTTNTLTTDNQMRTVLPNQPKWGKVDLRLKEIVPIADSPKKCQPIFTLVGWRELKVLQ